MARKLAFPDDKLFQMAYEGFLVTARGTKREEHKSIDRIITAFESISMEGDTVVPGFDPKEVLSPKRRYLDTTRDGIVILEEADYAYFKSQLDNLACPAFMSRTAARLHDFIDAAESGDPKTLAVRTAS